MKNPEKDILKDTHGIKQVPFSVPENYFGELKADLRKIPQHTEHAVSTRIKWGRAVAIAASFALLIAAGRLLTERNAYENIFTEEDFLVYSEELDIIIDEEYSNLYATAHSMTDEDIIEYLLAIGIEAEEVESF